MIYNILQSQIKYASYLFFFYDDKIFLLRIIQELVLNVSNGIEYAAIFIEIFK